MLNIGKEKMLGKKAKNLFLALAFVGFGYVLPYPGLMPGHRLYPLEQIVDYVFQFWAFGNFSRHKYELELADKKLVETKILFEYNQYLLALNSLQDSSKHFQKAVKYLRQAEEEGKDISQKMANFQAAAEKHQEILTNLQNKLPKEFLWQPEKGKPSQLKISQSLAEAIKIRDFK